MTAILQLQTCSAAVPMFARRHDGKQLFQRNMLATDLAAYGLPRSLRKPWFF
jgi:hypothetical protein